MRVLLFFCFLFIFEVSFAEEYAEGKVQLAKVGTKDEAFLIGGKYVSSCSKGDSKTRKTLLNAMSNNENVNVSFIGGASKSSECITKVRFVTSKCFDDLKEMSSEFRSDSDKGYGDSKGLLNKFSTFDYQFDENTQRHVPSIVQQGGAKEGITVITPSGTMKVSGRSCNLVSKKTSFKFIAEALKSGYEEIKLRDRIRSLAGRRYKKNGDLDRYKKLLKTCSKNIHPDIEASAKSILNKINGSTTVNRTKKVIN